MRRLLSVLIPIAIVAAGLLASTPGTGWAKAPRSATTTTARPLVSSTTAAPTTTAPAVTTTTAAAVSTTTAAPTTTTAPVTTTTAAPVTTTTAAPVTTTTTAAPAVVPTYSRSAAETFAAGWYTRWGFGQPWHTAVVAETSGNTFLRAKLVAGTHDGTSFRLPMPNADVAHLRYRVRYGATFNPAGAASNVKMPGFGNPNLDVNGVCLAACGLALADGVTAYSARSDIRQDGVPGWYVYDVDAALTLTYGRGERWTFPGFATGRWYTVDQYIRMNTMGQKDGSLATYIDGQKVFERTTYTFRNVPTLKVGNAWFDVYFGGSGVAPVNMDVDFDDVLLEWG